MGVFYDHILSDFFPAVHRYLESHESLKWTAKASAYAALLFLACFVAIEGTAGYQRLEYAGWIPRNHTTPVWIQGDWIVGEYRVCEMRTASPLLGKTLSPKVLAELPRLFCAKDDEGSWAFMRDTPQYITARDALYNAGDWTGLDGMFHVLPVFYQGRIDRPDKPFISWRCQRRNMSFFDDSALNCRALN